MNDIQLQKTPHDLKKNKAPWVDFNGDDIFEGDTIQHPCGDSGKVIFLPQELEPTDQWRIKYPDQETLSRLILQIGDKGQASVLKQ